MKAFSKLGLLFALLVSTWFQSAIIAQTAEQTVREAANSINQKIDEMHQLAERKKVYPAIDKLDEINKEINKEVTWGTFDEKYKEAKMQNPGFTFSIRGDLPAQLEPSFWEEYEARCNRIMATRKEATDGIVSMVQLNSWDKVMAYGSQLKTMYEAFTGAAENLGTANLPKFAYDLYGNMNEFIDNYKKIEQAELEGLEIQNFKMQLNLMASKAKRSQELYNEYKRYIKSSRIVIDDFKANIRYINKLKGDASSGPLAKLSYADNNYNWNYGPFQKEVQEACSEFAVYDIKCPDFKKNFEEINQNARQDWTKVQENIIASDDAEKKGEFLKYNDERWKEFLGVVNPIFNKTYNEFCLEQAQDNNKTPEPKNEPEVIVTPDPFDGSTTTAEKEKPKEPTDNKTDKPPAKKPPVNDTKVIPANNTKNTSTDRYWENTIPANATKEWMINENDEYEVRYSVNGRTVGYRAFKDPEFRIPVWESIRDNFAIKHGAQRKFSTDKEGRTYVYEIEFYKANQKIGICLRFKENGTVKYFYNGSEVAYRSKTNTDKSLHPIEAIEDTRLTQIIPTETALSVKSLFGNYTNMAYQNIRLPSNPVKLIRATTSEYTEYFLSPDVTKHEIGINRYASTRDGIIPKSFKLRFGNKVYYRFFSIYGNTISGKTVNFWLTANYYDKGIRSSDKYKVGPHQVNENPVKFYLFGKVVDAQTYQNAYSENRQLPAPDVLQSIDGTPPDYIPYADPRWASSNPLDLFIEKDAKIWRAESSNYSTKYYYAYNNNIAGIVEWKDKIQFKLSVYRDLHKVYTITWTSAGNPIGADIYGHIKDDHLGIRWIEDGGLKPEYDPPSGHKIKQYLDKYGQIPNTPSLAVFESPRLTGTLPQPSIPQAEITPLFNKIWGGVDIASHDMEIPVEDTREDQVENEDPNYEQLQKQEFFDLSAPISKKMDAATKAFDKPYWEESQGPRATNNPKQESLDLMRQAVQIAGRAIYPENKGALSFFIAYKLIDFSGRVFGYEAKQDFFLLAAEQVIKADQVLTKNKYLKQDISEAYCMSGEVWMEMTRKAQWGNHAFNKVACDKMVIQQYERAVQADPNNQKARKILEKLKTPKKPVPPAVEKFEKIPDESWNTAQTLREQMEKDIIEEKIEENFIEVADMTLDINKGTVSIKRSGVENWQIIKESLIPIFQNDRIKTSEDAEGVSITYTSDHTFLAIKPSSEVLIQDDQLMIYRGGASMRVIKKGNKFLVITPTYAVGVRGTEFEVNVGADKSTETYLYEGVVEIRNGTDVGYLVPGQKLIGKKDQEKFQQTDFNVAARKSSPDWIDLDAEKRKYDQAKANEPVVIPSGNPNPHQGGNSQPSGGNSSPSSNSTTDIWNIQSCSLDLEEFKRQVTNATNNGFIPVGLNYLNNQLNVLYLGGEILTISEWNMEWYTEVNSLQQGITRNMNEGYIPTGFSWSSSEYYVFYVKTEFTGLGWQIVPAPQDLTAVSNAIKPFIEQNYVPMGITLFGNEYYTLLVQFEEPLAKNWLIEGYQDSASEISNGIDAKLLQSVIPWGMLKSGGVANILYIGF